MARRPATLASLGSSGEQEEPAGPSTLTPPHTAPAQEQRQGRREEEEEDDEEEEMQTPREQPGQEEGEEEEYWEPPSIVDENASSSAAGTTLSLDGVDGMEEEEEEDDEGGAGWSLEAEMIRRRDAQLLGHTVDLALADDGAGNTGGVPMHDHDNENKEGDGDGEKVPRAYRGSNHGGSLASMEEGAVAPGVGREPSVSLSLSAAVSHATTAAAAAAAGRGEAPLPPVVEQQQGQEPSTGGGGLVVALMRTLRLDGGGGGGGGVGEEEKPPPSSAPRASQGRKKGSRVSPQAQQEEGERGRGASSASSALSSSSASSTRSRRVLGMDEPTAVAAALVAMSAFIYSLESVNVKLLGKDVGFWTISVWRGVVGLVCCALSYLAGRRTEHTHWLGQPELRRLLAFRGAMGAAAVISSFAALTNMDLADATSLMSTAPLWTALMAVLMNKGTWSRFDSAAAVCCTVGVLLVLKPGPLFPGSATDANPANSVALDGEMLPSPSAPSTVTAPRNNAFGVVSAIVCAVTTAAFTVMTRYVMEENTSVVSGYAMVACIILALPGMLYEQAARRGQQLVHGMMYDLVQLFLTGLFSYAAHMAKTYALQITRSLGVVVMRYLNILFAFVFEAFLFHQRVDPLAVAGAAVIVAGCVASILAQGARGQVVSSHQKQPSLALSSSAALAAAVIREAELAEAAGKVAVVRLPAA